MNGGFCDAEGLPLLTDENLNPKAIQILRDEGFDVLDVNEEGLASEDDLVLFRLAHLQRRAVVTHDSDFGRLAVANLEPMVGIVFLRPGHCPPDHIMGCCRPCSTARCRCRRHFWWSSRRLEARTRCGCGRCRAATT